MTPLYFQIEILKKNLGKNSPPGGSDPPNFLEKWMYPPRVMCLQNVIRISLILWLVGVCEHSKHVILALLRLYPRAQGVRPQKIFLHIFSWIRSMTPSNFQIDISKKNLWKKFPQDPQIFGKVTVSL